MITFLIIFLLCILFGIGFKLTGLVLGAVAWAVFRVPIAAVLLCVGIVCCCTLILIPIGILLFKLAMAIFLPGRQLFR